MIRFWKKNRGMSAVTTGDNEAADEDDGPRLVATNSGLEVYHIGKRYGGRPVVRDVSLAVQRGEAVGLLGPNGAGKTTCFYMITGLVRPDVGEIMLDGENMTRLPMYRRARMGIGYLPQEASIFRGLTVEQNILSVLEIVERDPSMRQMMLDELLAEFSITHLRLAEGITLSGGERRRCEIARALACRPSFILLDEPLAGIDPIAVEDVHGTGAPPQRPRHRRSYYRPCPTCVKPSEIIDRAYVMHEGTVLFEGTPSEIVANVDVQKRLPGRQIQFVGHFRDFIAI